MHEDDRENIVSYEQKRAFYLPQGGQLEGDHYADLRYITTIRQDQVAELPPVASMNEEGRRLLQFQLFRFFARMRLPEGWTTWTDEAEEERTA